MKKFFFGLIELCIHIIVYAFVIFLIYRAAVFSYDFAYNVFGDPVVSASDTSVETVVVEQGETAVEVAAKLKEAGVIKYTYAFVLRVRLEEMGDEIMPGTFELSPSMSVEEILEILTTEGDVIADDSDST